MTPSTRTQQSFIAALSRAVARKGIKVLNNPHQLVSELRADVEPSSEMEELLDLFQQACSERMPAPYIKLAIKNPSPSEDEIRLAGQQAKSQLIGSHTLSIDDTILVTNLTTQGIIDALYPRPVAPDPIPSPEPTPTPKPTVEEEKEPDDSHAPSRVKSRIKHKDTSAEVTEGTDPHTLGELDPLPTLDDTPASDADHTHEVPPVDVTPPADPEPDQPGVFDTPPEPERPTEVRPTPEPSTTEDLDDTKTRKDRFEQVRNAVRAIRSLLTLRRIGIAAGVLASIIALIFILFRTTVSFEGGKGAKGSMDDLRVWRNAEFALPECTYQRKGHQFISWKSDDGTFFEGQRVSVDGPTTFTATWGYTVHFDGNGATSGSMSDRHTSAKGSFELPKSNFKRKGYKCVGWSTTPNGKRLAPGTEVTLDEETTYYAVWRARITFDGNGATSGSVGRMVERPNHTVKLPKNGFKRSGYKFAGWATSSSGTPTRAGKRVSVDGPTTFYARWKPIVSFDGNGADSGSAEDIVADLDGRVTLPSRYSYDRDDYYCLGWATSRSGDPVDSYETVYVDGPTTYYAIWGPYIYFDANGGSGYVSSVHTDKNGRATLPSCSFTYTDHVFDGWATSSGGSGLYDPYETVSASSPKTYYATWKLDPDIGDKVASTAEGIDWDSGGHSTVIRVTNNSSTPLEVTAHFTFKDASGNELEKKENTLYAIAPSETKLIDQICSDTRCTTASYYLSFEELSEYREPLDGRISFTEEYVSSGLIRLKISNNSSKEAYITSATFHGKGYYGAETLFHEYVGYIDPWESETVTFESNTNPRWNEYYSREYSFNGYLKD